jgi:hypothetical protein
VDRFYLAYGSNLHPTRLLQRVSSAELVQVVRLDGYRIAFHKRGQDGSGKCSLHRTGFSGDQAYGAVYSLSSEQVPILDEFEGEGYVHEHLELDIGGQARRVFTYLAQDHYCDQALKPYRWYQQLVFWGARFHAFPDHYLNVLEKIAVIEDRNEERRELHDELLARMGAPMTGEIY